MKYIVYRDIPSPSSISVYHLYVLHENETYEIRERAPENPGVVCLIETCFVVIDGNGAQIDKRIGDVVSVHEDKRQARIEAGRLNSIVEVMEA